MQLEVLKWNQSTQTALQQMKEKNTRCQFKVILEIFYLLGLIMTEIVRNIGV